MTDAPKKTKQELRSFGLVMTVPLTLIGGYLWWKGSAAAPYVLGAAAFFLVTGLLVPALLRPIEKGWMKVAEILGAIMTRVILTVAFYLVITPFGLLLRVLRKDLLALRFHPEQTSYWAPVETDGPATRPDKPY
ncbi:MAG: SxtJ family membrane protein [Rhodothermales bacterium]|nr:SxtJ family membrane protein [Rhodothermales bacterium]